MQRRTTRDEYFGFRFAAAILDLLAMVVSRAQGTCSWYYGRSLCSVAIWVWTVPSGSGVAFLLERHAHREKELTARIVAAGGRHERDIHALRAGVFVGIDLGEHHLL